MASERLASIDDAAAIDATDAVVIDGRDQLRYTGESAGPDPRAGHIPGAHSLPARENFGPDGRLLEVEALRRRLAAIGIERLTAVVSYCGSGVTACHNLLVLEHAGVGDGRLFVGSWSQWAADPARPVATGD